MTIINIDTGCQCNNATNNIEETDEDYIYSDKMTIKGVITSLGWTCASGYVGLMTYGIGGMCGGLALGAVVGMLRAETVQSKEVVQVGIGDGEMYYGESEPMQETIIKEVENPVNRKLEREVKELRAYKAEVQGKATEYLENNVVEADIIEPAKIGWF